MKNDDLIIKYAHHFSVTTCNQLSRDSTPYPMNANVKMGVGFDYVGSSGYLQFNFRASPKSKSVQIKSHRMMFYIMNGYLPDEVDHANHDKLDNSFENLRAATISQNRMNTSSHKGSSSKYLGVTWCKRDEKWKSQISVEGGNKYQGCFTSETEAAKAYNTAAAKHFGEFANLNTIPGNE